MLAEVHSQTLLLGFAWTLSGVATAVVAARMVGRAVHDNLRVDDWLMSVAWIVQIISMVIITVSNQHGVGKHFSQLDPAQQEYNLHLIVGGAQLSCILPSMLGRISFAVTLLHIVAPTQRIIKTILWAVIATQIVVHVIVIVQLYAQCGTQISALWSASARVHAHCQSPKVQAIIGYVQSALNSLCDLTLSCVPGYILWNLNMQIQLKLGFATVLMMSIFAFIASIIKLLQTRLIGETNDVTWYSVTLQFWVTVENCTVIIAGSIPAVASLFVRVKAKISSHRSGLRSGLRSGRRNDSVETQQTREHRRRSTAIHGTVRVDSVSSAGTDAPLRPCNDREILRTTTLETMSEERDESEFGAVDGDEKWLQDLYCAKPMYPKW